MWEREERAGEAAVARGITTARLRELGLVDEMIEEPLGGAHRDYDLMAERIKQALSGNLARLQMFGREELVESRRKKLRTMGFVQ